MKGMTALFFFRWVWSPNKPSHLQRKLLFAGHTFSVPSGSFGEAELLEGPLHKEVVFLRAQGLQTLECEGNQSRGLGLFFGGMASS